MPTMSSASATRGRDLAARHPVRLQPERDVVGDPHVREQRVGLQHHADAALGRRQVGDVAAGQPDGAGRRPDEPGERVERGRLARPAGPEQRHRLTAATRRLKSTSAVGRLPAAAVGHADAVEGDCRRAQLSAAAVRRRAVAAVGAGLARISAMISSRWPSGTRRRRRRGRRARRSSPAPTRRRRRAPPAGVFGAADPAAAVRERVTHRDAERVGRDRLLDVLGDQERQQLLGDVGVRRTLGDARHVGQRDRGPLAVGGRRG